MNAAAYRKDFPLLNQTSDAYLDNAATTQKPQCVLDAVAQYYMDSNANPLRGLYDLSQRATDLYENARCAVADFIGAQSPQEIIFTRNATESLNLVAYSYARSILKPGDEVLISISEHHSNMLPWRQAAAETGAAVRYLECGADGLLTAQMLENALTPSTKLFAVAQVSNIFGRTNPIAEFAKLCHANGTVIVADGAQSVPHMAVNVQQLDVDFLAFSGHKLYAPMGIGVLYGKRALLEAMPPFLHGGEMIEYVTRDTVTYAELPHKFEAGTVNAGGAAGLHAAINYIKKIGFPAIEAQENALVRRVLEGVKEMPFVHVLGDTDPAAHHGIVTFTVDGVHPHDIAAIFDSEHICVRAGHHCAAPLHTHIGIPSTTRASFSFYNTLEEADRFLDCLSQIRRRMGYEA